MSATKTWAVGDLYWQADGEYSNNRLADLGAEPRETKEESIADAQTWLGWLSARERKMASAWAKQWRVTDVDSAGQIAGGETTNADTFGLEDL